MAWAAVAPHASNVDRHRDPNPNDPGRDRGRHPGVRPLGQKGRVCLVLDDRPDLVSGTHPPMNGVTPNASLAPIEGISLLPCGDRQYRPGDRSQPGNRGSVTVHAQGVTCGNRTRGAGRSVF